MNKYFVVMALVFVAMAPSVATAQEPYRRPIVLDIGEAQLRALEGFNDRLNHLESQRSYAAPATVQYQQPSYQPAYQPVYQQAPVYRPVYQQAPVYQQPTYAVQQQRYVVPQYRYVSQSFYNPATGASSGYAYGPVIGY